MTTALYRRYRPETFAEVIGQEHVTHPLSAALSSDRVNHAYLFSGPRGCGKTTSARILARCLNCEHGPTPTPCGTCPSCVELARGGPGSLDVVEIDAASHGGVDDARDLRERAVFAPVRDRFKVFIIDEAHMVSPHGFNALLKIVEEPPEHIRFIFATTEPEKVIGTIRSRTHHYPFRLVPPERLQNYLAEICQREGVEAERGTLPLVVRAGAGSVRDSLSVLDQLIAGSGADGLSYDTTVALLGYTDSALLDDVVDALSAGDGATVFGVVDRVVGSGHDPRRFVEDLLERFRDLLVLAAVRDGSHAVFRGLPEDQLARMQGQATRFGPAELSRAADVTNAALTEMTGATSPRLQLELLCARLLLPAADDEERGLRARVDRLEKRAGMAGPPAPPHPTEQRDSRPQETAPRRRVTTTPGPAPVDPVAAHGAPDTGWPEVTAPAGSQAAPGVTAATAPVAATGKVTTEPAGETIAGPDVETLRRMWPEVLTELSGLKRATWSLVSQHAQVVGYDGGRLVLGFGSSGLAASFGRGPHQEFLRQALITVLGLDCPVDAVSGDRRSAPAPTSSPATPPPPASKPPVADAARTAPVSRPQGQAAAKNAGNGGRTSADPYGDVPPAPLDEPPPAEDELPPDEGARGRRPAPSPTQRPRSVPPAASVPAPSPAAAPQLATAGARSTGARPASTRIDLTDDGHDADQPSADDPTADGSDLVGARVVEQLLGGRVIEEREE